MNYYRYFGNVYEGCPERIHPFWISREPVAWPWCNLAASQRRPYCESMNSHSRVGLVSRQWDAVDWACVLCDRRIDKSPPFKAILAMGKAISRRETNLGWQTWFMSCFAKKKKTLHQSCRMGRHIVVMKLICSPLGHCEWNSHTVHKPSQSSLTAEWLTPRESDYSQIHSKVSYDWLPITSRPRDRFSRYSNWPDTLRTALILRAPADLSNQIWVLPLKMEAKCSSAVTITVYQSTRCYHSRRLESSRYILFTRVLFSFFTILILSWIFCCRGAEIQI